MLPVAGIKLILLIQLLLFFQFWQFWQVNSHYSLFWLNNSWFGKMYVITCWIIWPTRQRSVLFPSQDLPIGMSNHVLDWWCTWFNHQLLNCLFFHLQGMIDYIFFSQSHLSVLGLLGPPEGPWLSQNIIGCPHPLVPSDHFSLLVQLELHPTPALPPAARPIRRHGGMQYLRKGRWPFLSDSYWYLILDEE